ncbi:MAG: DUF1059 domain-containing protein [Candidatus Micrarchaeaceae archaeon]
MKKFACKDIGMSCGFEARDNDKNKLIAKIRDHAKKAHGMERIDEATMSKIEAAIKEE